MQRQKIMRGSIQCLCAAMTMPLLFSGIAFSATADNSAEEAYSLGEVVVSAKNGGVEAAQTVREVTAEDIKARDARTLDEAIQLLPGLNVRNGGEGVPRIDIRGLKTRHVLLLLNGVPINSAIDQQFDPSIIPVENIAKIKMTVGPSSVLYGQGALAGVINIITKKGTRGFSAKVSGETGNREEYLGRASIAGGKEKFDYFLSGSSFKKTSFPLSDDFVPTAEQADGYRANSNRERNNFFANVGFQATDFLKLAMSFNYLQGKFGKPSSVIPASALVSNSNPAGDIFASKPKYERVDDFVGYSLQLAGDYAPASPFSMRSWAFINQMDQNQKGFDNNSYSMISRNGSYDVDVKATTKGFTLQPKYDFARAGVLTGSFSIERNSWDNTGFTIGRVGNQNNRKINADFKADYDIYSVSAQYEVEPVKNLGFTLGYGHFWQERPVMSDNDFSIMAGVHYDIFTGARLKAAFQRNIRFPSLEQLFDSANGGNTDLKTERSYEYEIGAEQKLPWNTLLSLSGFRTDAKNFIEKDANSVYQNFQEYRFYGFEAALESRFIENLVLRTSYSYLDSKDKSANATKDELQYRPKNKVAFEGWYNFAFGLTPYVSVEHVADQVTYDKDTQSIAYKMKNFTLVNFKLSQRLIKNRLNVYVGANNIFDENYETSYGFPQEGRFIYGGIEIGI